MNQNELLDALESARHRLGLSLVELRQLAFEVVQGVDWPVRSHADLDRAQLQKLLDVMEALERSQVARKMRCEELVTR
jgi:hypothetical protein